MCDESATMYNVYIKFMHSNALVTSGYTDVVVGLQSRIGFTPFVLESACTITLRQISK